ncbi:Uncharacterised protein [Yersinia kristensenii]|nr:Uncharacterised protein [Yersinia kristensenii]
MFAASAFVFVGGHLTTGDIQLFHEFTCQPTADLYPEAIGHDGRDTSGASIAAAGVPRFFDPAAFNHSLSIGFTSPAMPMLVAAAMNVKNQAQRRNRISRSKIVDYRKSLSESDIKSAVAIFRMSFSISRRCIFFFISRSSSWSGVSRRPSGVLP